MTQLNSQVSSWWWQVMISNNMKENLIPHHLLLLSTIISLIMILAVVLWLCYSSISNDTTKPSLPPGPLALPIVGYLPFLHPNLHTQFTHMARTYGPIFTVRVGTKIHIVINTPELAKMVVCDQDDIFANRILTVGSSIASYGRQDIVSSDNNANFRKLRKLLVHEVLSNKNLEACSCFRVDEVRKMIRNVYSKMGTEIKLNEVLFSTGANVITRMVWNSSTDERHRVIELQTAISSITKLLLQPNISDIFPCLQWFDLQGVKREMKRHVTTLDQILTRNIYDRIESNSKSSEDDVVGRKKDFLQILLELKDQKDATSSINITQMKALLMDIMVAGADTTTIVVEWAITEIMKNDTVMKRVQEELVEFVGLNNIVEESHLPKLQYLQSIVKETLRLHPPGPLLIPRSPSQTCIVGGYTIPKGCTIFLNVWSIHRDPRYWDNPLEFNPDRFFNSKGIDKYNLNGNNLKFFPFGSGRRSCPGIPLAEKMQMYILASLLHSFEWSLPKGEKHDLSHQIGTVLRKRKPLIGIPHQRLSNASLYT